MSSTDDEPPAPGTPARATAAPTPNKPCSAITPPGSVPSENVGVRRRTAPAGAPLARGRDLPPRRPGTTTQWLDLLTDDIHYFMPVRVTTALGAGYDTCPGMAHFDEDKYSLSRRVARFLTEHAWTEDPPSRLRHHLTNVRTFATDDPHDLIVESAVLLFRSRGDVHEPSLVSVRSRRPAASSTDDSWQLARRTIVVDESVLRMQNLAVFL